MFEEKNKSYFIIFLLVLILFPISVSAADFGYNNPNIPRLEEAVTTSTTINNNTVNVNNSFFWQGYTPSTYLTFITPNFPPGITNDSNANLTSLKISNNFNLSGFLFSNSTNVGIGVVNSYKPLTVRQAAQTSLLNQSGVIDIVGGNTFPVGSVAGINFHAYNGHQSTANVPHITIGERVVDSSIGLQSAFFVAVRDGNTGFSTMKEYFTVLPNGSVGISSTRPNYALEINHASRGLNVSGFLFSNSTNVGIGNSNLSSYPLHVESVLAGNQNIFSIINPNSIGNNESIDFSLRLATGAVLPVGRIRTEYKGNSNVGLSFSTFQSTLNERMRIDSGGFVGINSSSPSYLLEINSLSKGLNVSNNLFVNSTLVTINNDLNVSRNITAFYKSADGTIGFTGTCTIVGLTSITVKNGLITECT